MTMKAKVRQSHVCMRCGSQNVQVRHRSDVVDFKGLTLEVEGLASTVCLDCRHTWTTDGQDADNLAILSAAFAGERDRIREAEGLLTGEQIAQVLDDLQLSRADAAQLFGGGPNAFAKYIKGDVLQSVPMDRLLRLAVAFGSLATGYLRTKAKEPPVLYSAAMVLTSSQLAASTSAQQPKKVQFNQPGGSYVSGESTNSSTSRQERVNLCA
jgi:putative zinc finger/helix-turn-helix YgiT family protein